MRIVIDLQGAQGSNCKRGIGRYTLSLAKAIVHNRGEHEVFIALNGLLPEVIEPIRAEFNDLIPQENIRVWYSIGPISSLDTDNKWRRSVAELIRESFFANLSPDVVFVPSLFEGLADNIVVSIGELSHNFPIAVTLHDLIPLIYHKPYLENPIVEAWYNRQLGYLRQADMIIAISESSMQEAIHYLDIPPELVINASEGADSHFCVQHISPEKESHIRNKYGLTRPFVMYGGGIDHRKNVDGLIRAYARLPKKIRTQHQLAIVCAIQLHDQAQFKVLANKHGLSKGEIVFTGFVPEDDLLALYNLCKLFVFPSWHEGFGLPVLEAMSCGRAVIGSNSSSIPEVVGREDALFNPRSDEALAAKLIQVLTDNSFRFELERHGLEQAKKFSWDKTANLAISAFEKVCSENTNYVDNPHQTHRPKMAYVSPLPPERSGISDYSAGLLPELANFYDIDVIVDQDHVSDQWVSANCEIRNVEWFKQHAEQYNRVLYHFGNSHFHQHMFDLLDKIPGVVVLHDFFLSGIISYMDVRGFNPNGWVNELYASHGYNAVHERFHALEKREVVWKYPCNLSVLRNARGAIVHSEYSRNLLKHWYDTVEPEFLTVIPLLRIPVHEYDRNKARKTLNINADDFVVCSFGMLGASKLNHRLLESWLNSTLTEGNNCKLFFVGENDSGEYGQDLLASIRRSGLSGQVQITGWTDSETYNKYLAAADIAVQLRTNSRGETSAAVMDCMNYGLPTIVNANGSMSDLPDDAVLKLADDFRNAELTYAIEALCKDVGLRKNLGKNSREIIQKNHAPEVCGAHYYDGVEAAYRSEDSDINSLVRKISELDSISEVSGLLVPLAEVISRSIPAQFAPRQLLLDVSELVQRDSKSGIQRVVKSILQEWLTCSPGGFRVEPVYATTGQGYRYARSFTLGFLGCAPDILIDEPIEYNSGDIFLGLDLQPHVVPAQEEFYQQLRRHGVKVQFIVYDLLCVLMPENFIEGAKDMYSRWLEVVMQSDGVVCISKSVAKDVHDWYRQFAPERLRPFKISWFHLGADIKRSVPSQGLPVEASVVMKVIKEQTSFLMVGTIEPRKGYEQTFAAFEQLWSESRDVNLIIVAKEGWMVEDLVNKLRNHPESGKHLFWLEDVSDEFLEIIYQGAACLIASSNGEGFGLPLIEAAQHKLPIIARDIPVFREVAGDSAFYFDSSEPAILAKAIQDWLLLFEIGQHPSSESIRWQTWKESAAQLADAIGINTQVHENGINTMQSKT